MNTSHADLSGPDPSSNAIRRIGCISTSRADAGIYHPLLRALSREHDWEIVCYAGGTHLSQDFGHTIDELRQLDRVEVIPVEHHKIGDRPDDVAASAGQATIRFAKAFTQTQPDLVFVLGDRTEMLAAALAALIDRIPIAHLHGGERTKGAYDDQCRHAVTKLAQVHFPSLPQYAEHLRALGEESWRIHTVGALAIDALKAFKPEPVEKLSQAVGVDFTVPTLLVVFHPETLSEMSPEVQVTQLIDALQQIDANLLIIGTNADVGHAVFDRKLRDFADERPGAAFVASLPPRRFYSCMAHTRVMVGNSSAGIIEAASLRLPVVNVGARQDGRLRPPSVIDAPTQSDAIIAAVRDAMSVSYQQMADAFPANPYGDGHAAKRIIEALKTLPSRQRLLVK